MLTKNMLMEMLNIEVKKVQMMWIFLLSRNIVLRMWSFGVGQARNNIKRGAQTKQKPICNLHGTANTSNEESRAQNDCLSYNNRNNFVRNSYKFNKYRSKTMEL